MAVDASDLRVALVAPSLRLGGLERVVRDLAAGFVRRGIPTAVFVTESAGEYAATLREVGIPVVDCSARRPRMLRVPTRLYRRLARFRPTIIHAHSGSWLPASLARALLRRPRLVFTDHGRYLPEPRYRAVTERQIYYRQTDRVVAVSGELAAYLQAFLNLERAPDVVPNGVDLSEYGGREPSRRAELRGSWGLKDDRDILAVAVGRLETVKNHEGMLEAVALARSTAPGLRLAIVGMGGLEAALRQRAVALGLEHDVLFLGHRRDVADCLAAADVFVSASTSEGLPISLLEAMGAGLPIVTTAVGGIPDALGTPPAGVLVPAGQPDALAEALADLATDPRRRAELGRAASLRSREFGLDACVEAYLEVYREVLGDQARPRITSEAVA
jgi:L-malate glycosyltransferase